MRHGFHDTGPSEALQTGRDDAMKRFVRTLARRIKALDAALIERGRPPRRSFELPVHPSRHGPRNPQRPRRSSEVL